MQVTPWLQRKCFESVFGTRCELTWLISWVSLTFWGKLRQSKIFLFINTCILWFLVETLGRILQKCGRSLSMSLKDTWTPWSPHFPLFFVSHVPWIKLHCFSMSWTLCRELLPHYPPNQRTQRAISWNLCQPKTEASIPHFDLIYEIFYNSNGAFTSKTVYLTKWPS